MNDLVTKQEMPVKASMTPNDLIMAIIDRGGDLPTQQLAEMMSLQERWEANEARKAFVKAMAEFKANPPELFKDISVAYKETSYRHASLASVCDAVVSAMSKHGLSHRWEISQEGGDVTVACTITHDLGHSESVSMTAPPDTSGSKNRIQQIASTVTYLERYTLMAACGVAAKDMDDDALLAGPSAALLTDDQVQELYDLAKEADADVPRFLKAIRVDAESLDGIPASKFEMAKDKLRAKIQKTLAKEGAQ